MTIIYAVFLLLILITVHECGHFLSARLTGVPVREFAIGMGPKILSWKSRKYSTAYSLRLIPCGGYCAFVGEDDRTAAHADDPESFGRQPVWKRMLTVFMGAGMNFILALAAAALLVTVTPLYNTVPIPDSVCIHTVDAESPASRAGIEPGDQIVAVNGVPVDLNASRSLVDTLNAQAKATGAVELSIARNGETLSVNVVPRYAPDDPSPYKLGVTIGVRTEQVSGHVLKKTLTLCGEAAMAIFDGIRSLFTTPGALEQVSGPVGIVTLVSDVTASGGLTAYAYLLIVISINLGIMNLLPIPGLDGSRILFMLFELLRGRPVAPKKEAVIHLAGYALLFGLLLLLTYKDIVRLISGG